MECRVFGNSGRKCCSNLHTCFCELYRKCRVLGIFVLKRVVGKPLLPLQFTVYLTAGICFFLLLFLVFRYLLSWLHWSDWKLERKKRESKMKMKHGSSTKMPTQTPALHYCPHLHLKIQNRKKRKTPNYSNRFHFFP